MKFFYSRLFFTICYFDYMRNFARSGTVYIILKTLMENGTNSSHTVFHIEPIEISKCIILLRSLTILPDSKNYPIFHYLIYF